MKQILLLLMLHITVCSQTESNFDAPPKVRCNGTLLKISADSIYISINDSCTDVTYDSSYNGVYVFTKMPANTRDRVVTIKNKETTGSEVHYYKSGKIRLKGSNKNGLKKGKWIEYYESGEVECVSLYKKDNITSQKCFLKNGKHKENHFANVRWLD